MIRLGLRLTFGGGKEALIRLAVMAAALALGVGMLLATLATMNGLHSQNARGAWLGTSPNVVNGAPHPSRDGANVPSGKGQLWWLVNNDEFRGDLIVRVDVASAGPDSPVPPGISKLPSPGQFYASPALVKLLQSVPAADLADRFGRIGEGIIATSVLPSPSDYVVIVGDSVQNVSGAPGAGKVTGFATSGNGPETLSSTGLTVLLAILALVLIFPVLTFVATATRLSAARREQRFAAMRLVGATPRQVSFLATLETGVAAILGLGIGYGLFFLSRPLLISLPMTGQRFEPSDISLNLTDVLLVMFGIPLATALIARAALRRVRISPLGVTNRTTPPAPKWYRVIPLLAGIAELAYFVAIGHPKTASGQTDAYFLGFLLVMFGLVLSGPWITMVAARVMATRSRRAPTLIAGRRLADNPKGSFRAISGLILALFVTSVAIGLTTTMLGVHGSTASGSAASSTMVDSFDGGPYSSVPAIPSTALRSLRKTSGVTAITLVYTAPSDTRTDGRVPNLNGLGGDLVPAVVSCAQLAKTPALGRCHTGANYTSIGPDLGFMPVTKSPAVDAQTTWPTAHFPGSIANLPVQMVAVSTNGSEATLDRVQTILDAAFPFVSSTSPLGSLTPDDSQFLDSMQKASEAVIAASLLIAGCSLVVSMVAGISERKRPFGLLRLTGVPLRLLRMVVALETAAPLSAIAVITAATGYLASDLFLRSQLGITIRAPGAAYFAIVVGGIAVVCGLIGSTMPLLDRMTRPENIRTQ